MEAGLEVGLEYRRFWWPHPYARERRRLWVNVVIGYRHFVDGEPFPKES